jgi:uncharacterized RDD family membrane protein YckC
MSDEGYYLQAKIEVDSEEKDMMLWAKAETLTYGDKEKAKHQYIKLRVEQLKGNEPTIDDINPIESNVGELLKNWHTLPVHPWRRYFAILIDIPILGVSTWFLLFFILYMLNPSLGDFLVAKSETLNPIVDSFITTFIGCLVSGVILGKTGTTPGKLIFGITVRNIYGHPIGIKNGIERCLQVWTKGLGVGIPIISLFTLFSSKSYLEKNGNTRWDDAGKYTVYYKNSVATQIAFGFLLVVVILFILAFLNSF